MKIVISILLSGLITELIGYVCERKILPWQWKDYEYGIAIFIIVAVLLNLNL